MPDAHEDTVCEYTAARAKANTKIHTFTVDTKAVQCSFSSVKKRVSHFRIHDNIYGSHECAHFIAFKHISHN